MINYKFNCLILPQIRYLLTFWLWMAVIGTQAGYPAGNQREIYRNMLGDSDWKVRNQALEQIKVLNDLEDSLLDDVFMRTRDPHPQVQRNAFRLLGRTRQLPEEILADMRHHLASSNSMVRLYAAFVLYQHEPRQDNLSLIADSIKDGSPYLQYHALGLIPEMRQKPKELLLSVVELLGQNDYDLVAAASQAILSYGSEAKITLPELRSTLQRLQAAEDRGEYTGRLTILILTVTIQTMESY